VLTTDSWSEEVELLPIVVGIHLDAEMYDRPRALRIVEAIRRWQHAYCDEPICRPVVMTDALYLSSEGLQRGAVISLGPARVNALTAGLAERLPVVFSQGGRMVVQADWSSGPPRLCLWADAEHEGARIIDRLIDVELDEFLEAVAARTPAV